MNFIILGVSGGKHFFKWRSVLMLAHGLISEDYSQQSAIFMIGIIREMCIILGLAQIMQFIQ
jgi:hypothetical protein